VRAHLATGELVHRTDNELHIHFDPGTRLSYSGEGFILLQFVIEHGEAMVRKSAAAPLPLSQRIP